MDLFQFNKVAGAVLGTLLFVQGVVLISDAIFSHPQPAKPGYPLPSGETAAAPQAKPGAAEESLPELLAKADPKKGEADTAVCHLCHNFGKGEGIKIGPPLWGVVGRLKGSVPGFDYSAGMKAKGGTWTFEDLFTFIKDPQAYVPGTKMTFAGEPDPHKRADIIAYLRTLSDNPLPLPKAAAAATPAVPPAAAAPAAPAAKPPAATPATPPAAPAAQAPAATPAAPPAAPAAQSPAATPATPPAAPAAQAPAATPAAPPAAPAAQSPAATPPAAAPTTTQSPAATPPAATPAAPAAQPPAAPAPQ